VAEIIHPEESYAIQGACFEVYKDKGCGYLEEVYHECLKIEFGIRGLPFRSKEPMPLVYKGHTLSTVYKPDFICFDKIILEIKAVTSLANIYRAKVQHYLRSSGFRLGLLVNFHNHPKLELERILL
jgi:GxxExxY protein